MESRAQMISGKNKRRRKISRLCGTNRQLDTNTRDIRFTLYIGKLKAAPPFLVLDGFKRYARHHKESRH
jgi:hypothetical protein